MSAVETILANALEQVRRLALHAPTGTVRQQIVKVVQKAKADLATQPSKGE